MKIKTIKVSFYLRYHTTYGQSIWIYGNHPLLGSGDPQKAQPLVYLNENYWKTDFIFPLTNQKIEYHYILRDESGKEILEWGNDKFIDLKSISVEQFQCIDTWNDEGYIENVFYKEPFEKILLKENISGVAAKKINKTSTHLFRVKAPLLQKGQTLALIGASPLLGAWDTLKTIPLAKVKDTPFFEVALNLREAEFPLSYKYGIYDIKKKLFINFETGNNRILTAPFQINNFIFCNDGFAAFPDLYWKGAGVAIPVFSLRSKNSGGVGEFADIKLLVDWSKKIGLSLIQLLPINDTTATHTATDSYPYAAISAFALHPLYIHIEALITPTQKNLIQTYKKQKVKLNQIETVDYVAVMQLKWKTLRILFEANGANDLASPSFNTFYSQNAHWLVPYSVFSYLRELYGTVDFNTWPTHTKYNELEIQKLIRPTTSTYKEISFYYYVQFHLHTQLTKATQYANKKGIIVKGDIPIGVYRYGVDAWQHPELFYMDRQAGAPPDDFAIKGQNWGFPTYQWKKMACTNFHWWKQRFEQMRFYFDAFRIDHILGFFRIWSIPLHAVDGIMGRFVPALPFKWQELIAKGITCDASRLTQPFINENILWQLFGNDNDYVKQHFLTNVDNGLYQFLPSFQSQVQVVNHFKTMPKEARHQSIKDGLLHLLTNVILLEDDIVGSYHFRFNIESTTSFQHLDETTKTVLKELYNDYFFVKQNHLWEQEALAKLPHLKRATNMLICGEDLGLVPACLPEVMKQLGILSLEVQRMPKASNTLFFNPIDAPYLSVVTPSSHDTSTIRGWWEEDPQKTQQFFNEVLAQKGEAPSECTPWINKAIMLQHLNAPAMWSIFQWQDFIGVDAALRRNDPQAERINDPSNATHYWRYRMHLSLESLLKEKSFNDQWAMDIKESGR